MQPLVHLPPFDFWEIVRPYAIAEEEAASLDADTRHVLIAFQRRYRPTLVDGDLDPETSQRLAAVEHAVSALRARRT